MEYSLETKIETPERLFLRYALPCTFHLILQKKIPQESADYLKKSYLENKIILRPTLKRIFKTAYEEVIKLGEFNNENIQKYFLELHNDFVDRRETIPEGLKDFCKIQEAQIITLHDKYKATVVFNSNKIREVKTQLVYNSENLLEEGNLVKVHWYYVVDRIQSPIML